MKDQVTSIEQSRRLLELGVPAEKASMIWEMDEDCARLKIWNTDEETRRVLHHKYPDYYYPAFTVVDLLEMLPAGITYGRMHITRSTYSKGEDWRVFYKRVGVSKGCIVSFGDCTLIQPVCDMIEWLLSDGYKLEL